MARRRLGCPWAVVVALLSMAVLSESLDVGAEPGAVAARALDGQRPPLAQIPANPIPDSRCVSSVS